jgi:hypothetical protein
MYVAKSHKSQVKIFATPSFLEKSIPPEMKMISGKQYRHCPKECLVITQYVPCSRASVLARARAGRKRDEWLPVL